MFRPLVRFQAPKKKAEHSLGVAMLAYLIFVNRFGFKYEISPNADLCYALRVSVHPVLDVCRGCLVQGEMKDTRYV